MSCPLLLFYFYYSLMCYILNSYPFFNTLPAPLCLLSEKSMPLGTLIKHCISSYNKSRHVPSHQCWMKRSRMRKRIPQAGNRIRDRPLPSLSPSLCPHSLYSHKNTELHSHDIYDIDQTPTDSQVSASPHESLSVDFCRPSPVSDLLGFLATVAL